MALDYHIRSGGRLLRCGVTTGTCAALAASGAVRLLLTGQAPETMVLVTPRGLRAELPALDCRMDGVTALCAVRKDAGDDPDVTDGLLVYVRAEKTERGIEIAGGEGVGVVTKPGLDQPVGTAAINSVPRRMIRAAAEEVCAETGYAGGLRLTVSIPEGGRVVQKTFNPQLGIDGGLSILGTSGIVEPMSERAIVDTVAVEIRQAVALGARRLILTPGNYGMDYLQSSLPELAGIPTVKCSNYIGDAIDAAVLEGVQELLLVGHIGKLVKLAGGIMNTHSRNADCRMELLTAHAALCGASAELCRGLMDQVSTEACIALLDGEGLRRPVMESLLGRIQTVLDRRCGGAVKIGALTFSNEYGLLGETAEAGQLRRRWREP